MKRLLYAPLHVGSWLWRRFWLWVWTTSEFLHIPLGRLAPWVFGQMTGMKGTRMEQCERCGQTMDALRRLNDLKVTGVSLVLGAGVGLEGYAKPEPIWHCSQCGTSVPVKRRDRKRWKTLNEHEIKKQERLNERDGEDGSSGR